MQAQSIDRLYAARHNLGYFLFGHVYVLAQLAAEETRLSDARRFAYFFFGFLRRIQVNGKVFIGDV
jgi:hypothetical protein